MMNNEISLADFRSWLQGVEDMQEEGWTPTAVQWNKIRQKIDQIVEKPVKYGTTTGQIPPGSIPRPAPVINPTIPPSSTFDNGSHPRVSSVFAPPPMRPETPKTPDIDTSNGQYTTLFT